MFALALLLVAPLVHAGDADFQAAASPGAYAGFRDGAPGAGGLRSHAVVVTVRDVVVYRLYDSRATGSPGVAGRMGKFWTDFSLASESEARDQLAVCKGWNDMAKVVQCTLPRGSTLVRGPGQAANCADLTDSGSMARHPGGPPQLFILDTSVLTSCSDASTGW